MQNLNISTIYSVHLRSLIWFAPSVDEHGNLCIAPQRLILNSVSVVFPFSKLVTSKPFITTEVPLVVVCVFSLTVWTFLLSCSLLIYAIKAVHLCLTLYVNRSKCLLICILIWICAFCLFCTSKLLVWELDVPRLSD